MRTPPVSKPVTGTRTARPGSAFGSPEARLSTQHTERLQYAPDKHPFLTFWLGTALTDPEASRMPPWHHVATSEVYMEVQMALSASWGGEGVVVSGNRQGGTDHPKS